MKFKNKIEVYRYQNAKHYLKQLLCNKIIYWKDINRYKLNKYIFGLIDKQFLFPDSWFYFTDEDEGFFKIMANSNINNIEIYKHNK